MFGFLKSTLPWIAIGLFVACSSVTIQAKKEGKAASRLFMGVSWGSAACFLFVAIMELYSGNKSSATTWLVLGIFNTIINYANTQTEDKE